MCNYTKHQQQHISISKSKQKKPTQKYQKSVKVLIKIQVCVCTLLCSTSLKPLELSTGGWSEYRHKTVHCHTQTLLSLLSVSKDLHLVFVCLDFLSELIPALYELKFFQFHDLHSWQTCFSATLFGNEHPESTVHGWMSLFVNYQYDMIAFSDDALPCIFSHLKKNPINYNY